MVGLKKRVRPRPDIDVAAIKCVDCGSELQLDPQYTMGMTKCSCGGLVLSRHKGKNEVFCRQGVTWEPVCLPTEPEL